MRRAIVLGVVATAVAALAAGCGGGNGQEGRKDAATTTAAVPFDRAFIDAMVPHHEEAIAMARGALDAGLAQPELVRIAKAIVATQQGEIDRMRAWRAQWYGSAEIDPAGAAALGMSTDEMGMQHDARDLSGSADVDGDFASMMVDHHEGAIAMARTAERRAGHRQIRDLAAAIVEAQQREVATLREHAGMHH